MNTLKKLSILIALPLVLVLAGCGVQASAHTDSKASSAPSSSAAPAVPTGNPLIKHFGEVVTYKDGVSVSANAPTPYQPTESGAMAANIPAGFQTVVLTLVVTNHSQQTLDQSGFPQATSGGKPATTVSDIAANVGNTPNGPLLVGQTIQWQEAFAVADPTDITLSYAPSYDYQKAIFSIKYTG